MASETALDKFEREQAVRLKNIAERLLEDAAANISSGTTDLAALARSLSAYQAAVRAGHWFADPWLVFEKRVEIEAARDAVKREAAE